MLIIDDTQMIKTADKSVRVAPQHCGATNQIENCQVYTSDEWASFIGGVKDGEFDLRA